MEGGLREDFGEQWQQGREVGRKAGHLDQQGIVPGACAEGRAEGFEGAGEFGGAAADGALRQGGGEQGVEAGVFRDLGDHAGADGDLRGDDRHAGVGQQGEDGAVRQGEAFRLRAAAGGGFVAGRA